MLWEEVVAMRLELWMLEVPRVLRHMPTQQGQEHGNNVQQQSIKHHGNTRKNSRWLVIPTHERTLAALRMHIWVAGRRFGTGWTSLAGHTGPSATPQRLYQPAMA